MTPTHTTPETPAQSLATLDWLAQRRAAAEALWTLGYTPESYAILRHGLSDAVALLRGSSEVTSALLSEVGALLTEAEGLSAPLSRSDFSRAHAAWFERARAMSHRLQQALGRARTSGTQRMSLWVVACAVLLIASAFALRVWERQVYAYAPATYGPEHAAANAVDGHRATEWLLPDGASGHLDLSLATRRAVHDVTIINAHNRQFMDRAIKRALVLVFDDKVQVDRAEVSFEKIEGRAAPQRVSLKGLPATRVRIQVLEHFGLGGGIADVSVD